MTPPRIAVLDYGIGNLRSAEKALQRVGADARLTARASEAETADGVVLPGVGAFGPCARALRDSGLAPVAARAVEAGVPFLGICVGLQLLYAGSEESEDEPGLGVIDGRVRLLQGEVKRPQMQWNVLQHDPGPSRMLAGLGAQPWLYFVHSFAPERTPETVAFCEYGGPVVAAIERGSLWGVQFHPEKSGETGLKLLDNFVRACAA
ncbi:MAG TPA: imidazole glycerol phosphate synthase subunit HisH [Acidimicrobiales bacterium]|nr:imidazole glycerol phosphate synthase subunit HisH [Acidimicrobiales bacterium]